MSKIERLNARVAKLLTVAMDEILEVVRGTVLEYQEKTARTQRENESLKRRVQELQDKLIKTNSGPVQPAAFHVFGEQESTEQWQSRNLGQDVEHVEHLLIEEKREPAEELSTRHMEEELGPLDSDNLTETETDFSITDPERSDIGAQCVSQMSDTDMSLVASNLKSGSKLDSVHIVSVPGRLSPGGEPAFVQDEIKIEVDSPDCITSKRHGAQSPFYEQTDDTLVTQEKPTNETPQDNVALSYTHFQSSYSATGKGLLFKNVISTRNGRIQKQYCKKDEEHRCILCGKTFSRIGNLRIHQRCHTGEKPYCCTQCGRCFSQAGDLKKHKRVHTGEKPYYCVLCGKSFSRGENLKRHQKIHYGDTLQLHQFWRDPQTNAML